MCLLLYEKTGKNCLFVFLSSCGRGVCALSVRTQKDNREDIPQAKTEIQEISDTLAPPSLRMFH